MYQACFATMVQCHMHGPHLLPVTWRPQCHGCVALLVQGFCELLQTLLGYSSPVATTAAAQQPGKASTEAAVAAAAAAAADAGPTTAAAAAAGDPAAAGAGITAEQRLYQGQLFTVLDRLLGGPLVGALSLSAHPAAAAAALGASAASAPTPDQQQQQQHGRKGKRKQQGSQVEGGSQDAQQAAEVAQAAYVCLPALLRLFAGAVARHQKSLAAGG
jgi:hypothetical protein